MQVETKRLTITKIRLEDKDAYHKYYLKNKEFLRKWGARHPVGFFSNQHWDKLIVKYVNDPSSFRFLIRLKSDPSTVIGAISFTNIARGVFNSCVLGYKLDYDHEGQGLMTEAVDAAIDYMFNEQKLHRVEAGYMPHNFRSGALLKKIGFHKIGLAPKYLYINGRWEDHVIVQKINEHL